MYDVSFLVLLLLLADVAALVILVGKLFGSISWHWAPCLFGILGTWAISFFIVWHLVEAAKAA